MFREAVALVGYGFSWSDVLDMPGHVRWAAYVAASESYGYRYLGNRQFADPPKPGAGK